MSVKTKKLYVGLVLKSVAGESDALDSLFEVSIPRIWRTVRLVWGGGTDAEDIVQTVVITAMEKLSTYRGPDRFGAWLDRITVNVIYQEARRRRLRRFIPWVESEHETGLSRTAVSPEDSASHAQLLERLSRQLKCLGLKKRTALVLSLFHGYTAAEIADITGSNTEAVWKRIRRGHRELMANLGRDIELLTSLSEYKR